MLMLRFQVAHRCSAQEIGRIFSELYRCYTEAIKRPNLITNIEVELKYEASSLFLKGNENYNDTAATAHMYTVSQFLDTFVEAE